MQKKHLRIMTADAPSYDAINVRRVKRGRLVQQRDRIEDSVDSWRVVTNRAPTPSELADCIVAWKVCAAVMSNAIVIAQTGQAVGIGGGQQNRVDAARIAVSRAGNRCVGASEASDAFFPFADGLEILAESGGRAIIQHGGRVRGEEVISAAEGNGALTVVP